MCLGLATADLIVELPGWPDPDGRLVVEAMRRCGGGPAATAAVAAARLGRSVAMCGAVGTDRAGAHVRDGLVAERVDVALLVMRDGRTSESVILLDRAAATRSILHAPGVTLDALPPGARTAVEAASWIHVDHAGWPVAVAADLPRARLSVDVGNPIDQLDLAGIGLYTPTSRALAARYPGRTIGDAVNNALAEGARRVVVTRGGDGAVAADESGAWRAPPLRVEVRSTLGAGDVFHGALVAGLAGGHSLADALARANLAAALSCRGLDGREAIPSTDELTAALAAAAPVEPIMLAEVR